MAHYLNGNPADARPENPPHGTSPAVERCEPIADATSHLPAATPGELAQSAFLNLAIRFEGFRHEWHMAAIARDASVVRESLVAEARKTIEKDRRLAGIKDFVRVDLPRHPTISDLQLVLQPDGRARPPSLKD